MRLFTSPRWIQCLQLSCVVVAVIVVMLASFPLLAQARGKETPSEHPPFYRTMQIDGLSIFFREAGRKDAPTILLLHGLPSASRMGFGRSDWPDLKKFAYTFDHCTEITNHFN